MNTSALASIERLSQAWWDWVVAASWQLAVLTCLVAVAVTLLRRASPRLRHALWLLVVLKAFLPPGLTAPWSVGRLAWPWLDAAGVLSWRAAIERGPDKLALNAPQADESSDVAEATTAPAWAIAAPTTVDKGPPTTVWLMFLWGAGLLVFWGLVAGRYLRLLVTLRDAQVIDEGPLRVELERIALALGVKRVPELLVTPQVTSPFLFGVIRPRIVLPAAMIDGLGNQEMRAVLTHELMHWQRHDVLLGWLQVGAQGLFWFHPLVWWANRELRHKRECACDEAVLRHGNLPSRQYGDSIVRVLTTARGRSLAAGSLVGVFERGTKLQNRLEEIMDFETRPRTSSWFSRVTLVAFALLALPMAPGGVRPTAAADDKNAVIAPAAQAPAAEPTPYPQIVSTVPPVGATNVDPTFSEITVTFDRDMQGGMSWTGGPPEFPDTCGKAKWKDRRTCVLPVKLAAASIYRVGINSTSFQNFRSAGGVAARPAAIYFVTKGASPDMILRVRVPQVVTIVPAEGATDVDPSIKQLRVTFDMPMGDGMSWVDAGPNFPPPDRAKQAAWSADGLTCTLPVELEPGRDYKFGLNDLNHINFQSRHGVPLVPVVYRFRTAAK